jgi:hypothetical protein
MIIRIIRLTYIVYWITNATNTHSEYVIFIDFSRASILRCTYITCLVCSLAMKMIAFQRH